MATAAAAEGMGGSGATPVEHGLQEFVRHVEALKQVGDDGNSGFAREFSMLRARMLAYQNNNVTTAHGHTAYNLKKNRYKDIIP